jgi:hypothetical protein
MWEMEAFKKLQFVVKLKVLLSSGLCCLDGRNKNLLHILDRDISWKITTWKSSFSTKYVWVGKAW